MESSDAQSKHHYCGSIKSHWIRTTHIVTMRAGLASDDGDTFPPDLYNPVFSTVRDQGLRLHGVELIDGAAVAQEWVIDFLCAR